MFRQVGQHPGKLARILHSSKPAPNPGRIRGRSASRGPAAARRSGGRARTRVAIIPAGRKNKEVGGEKSTRARPPREVRAAIGEAT